MDKIFITVLLGPREGVAMGAKMGPQKSACGFRGRRYSKDREGFPGDWLLNLQERVGDNKDLEVEEDDL